MQKYSCLYFILSLFPLTPPDVRTDGRLITRVSLQEINNLCRATQRETPQTIRNGEYVIHSSIHYRCDPNSHITTTPRQDETRRVAELLRQRYYEGTDCFMIHRQTISKQHLVQCTCNKQITSDGWEREKGKVSDQRVIKSYIQFTLPFIFIICKRPVISVIGALLADDDAEKHPSTFSYCNFL